MRSKRRRDKDAEDESSNAEHSTSDDQSSEQLESGLFRRTSGFAHFDDELGLGSRVDSYLVSNLRGSESVVMDEHQRSLLDSSLTALAARQAGATEDIVAAAATTHELVDTGSEEEDAAAVDGDIEARPDVLPERATPPPPFDSLSSASTGSADHEPVEYSTPVSTLSRALRSRQSDV